MLAPETASLSLRGDRPDGAYRDPIRPVSPGETANSFSMYPVGFQPAFFKVPFPLATLSQANLR